MKLLQFALEKINPRTQKTAKIAVATLGMTMLVSVMGLSVASAWTQLGNVSIFGKLAIGTESPATSIHFSEEFPRLVVEDSESNKWVRLGAGRNGSSIVFNDDGFLNIEPRADFLVGNPVGKGIRIEGSGNVALNGNVAVSGNLEVICTKNFVQDHPQDANKEIVYTALEGSKAGTYFRSKATLVNGNAVIDLPEHFEFVTAENTLTVVLTPVGQWLQLFVVSKSTQEILIQEASGQSGQVDFLVQGIPKGFETKPVIREETTN